MGKERVMNKKSFLRGFGIGVLFAAVILGISFTIRTSDSYVLSKAKELGMVYKEDQNSGIKLAEATPDASSETTETPDADQKKTVQGTEKPKDTDALTPAPTSSDTAKADENKKATPNPQKELEDEKKKAQKELLAEKKKAERELQKEKERLTKSLTVDVGDWSSDVSKKLESLGVIKDAKDFDKYLNDNGFSSSISAGTYKVSIGDTYNELARKITKR